MLKLSGPEPVLEIVRVCCTVSPGRRLALNAPGLTLIDGGAERNLWISIESIHGPSMFTVASDRKTHATHTEESPAKLLMSTVVFAQSALPSHVVPEKEDPSPDAPTKTES